MKKLTFINIKPLIPREVYLYHVDYMDKIYDTEIISEYLNRKDTLPLIQYIDNAFIGCEDLEYYKRNLKSSLMDKFDLEDDEVDSLLDDYNEDIEECLWERDKSDIIGDVISNTDDLNVRIEMHSNYDMINSHYFNTSCGSYYSYNKEIDGYFSEIVDILNLNPKKVYDIFKERYINVDDSFIDIPNRNGKEYVDYIDFVDEIESNSSGGLLTFLGGLDLKKLYEKDFKIDIVTIPKGNRVGIQDSSCGGGSIFDMKLIRDFKIDLSKEREGGVRGIDIYEMVLDDNSKYTLKDCYDVTNSFFYKLLEL